jgi:hypothetical protein
MECDKTFTLSITQGIIDKALPGTTPRDNSRRWAKLSWAPQGSY